MARMSRTAKHRISYLFLQFLLQRYGMRLLPKEEFQNQKRLVATYLKDAKIKGRNDVLIDLFFQQMHERVCKYLHGDTHRISFAHKEERMMHPVAHAYLLILAADFNLTDIIGMRGALMDFCSGAKELLNGESMYIEEYVNETITDIFSSPKLLEILIS